MKFPLIEYITMEVAKKCGMIQPRESNTKEISKEKVLVTDLKK